MAFPNSRCASCSKPACISATKPGAGTRRWRLTSSASRNGIHIIDLSQTVPMLHQALETCATWSPAAAGCCSSAPSARPRSRWPGGQALRAVLRQLPLARRHADQLQDHLAVDPAPARARRADQPATGGLTKKRAAQLTRQRDKLERALGGIKEMGGLPDILFVIDTNKEAIAVREATGSIIPVVAILDSNSSPEGIAYPIPGNDDAMRAIHLYCDLVSNSVLDGLRPSWRPPASISAPPLTPDRPDVSGESGGGYRRAGRGGRGRAASAGRARWKAKRLPPRPELRRAVGRGVAQI